jgi:hypothetical protein
VLIVDRKAFAICLALAISFLGVLALIFTPVFGGGMNGLQYADDLFNRLSKGSSYFIPKVAKSVEAVAGSELDVRIRLDGEAALVLEKSVVVTRHADGQASLQGSLPALLRQALRDAEEGYRNDSAALASRYGLPAQTVLATWWQVLQRLDKALKQERRLVEAKAVHEVMKKAIEPAHNYYGIEARRVVDMVAPMSALLLFYVAYTVWWGYAMFFLFQGFGLMMKKKAK